MRYCIKRDAKLRGTLILPASKSISNRALMMIGMHKTLNNVSHCHDTEILVDALTHLHPTIDVGAAGTAMRFLTAYLSLRNGEEHILTGTERMKHRPIRLLVDALRQVGADIAYMEQEGFPPLCIKGKDLLGGELCMEGHISSQYTSALLMAAPYMLRGITLRLTGEITSRPYIEMTLRMMRAFGIKAGWISDREIRVQPGTYQPIPFHIENDWSASSYWYEIMALSHDVDGCLHLPGLFSDSMQGDHIVAKLFEPLGVLTEYTSEGITLRKGHLSLREAEMDFSNCPDLAQTMIVTAAMLGIPFRFTGVHNLRIKETDRISAIICEMARLGYILNSPTDDVICWEGTRGEKEIRPIIHTYQDHRMAMALTPASMLHGTLEIEDPQVVRKSYPNFWDDLFSIFPSN